MSTDLPDEGCYTLPSKHLSYTMEYYSAFKKKEILSFATTGVNLGQYTKWNKLEKDKYRMISRLCGIWTKNGLVETESRKNSFWLPEAGVWANTQRLVKRYKLSAIRWTRPEDLMHNVVTTADNTVFYNWNLLIGELKCSHTHAKGKYVRWSMCSLTPGNYQIITLCTLNILRFYVSIIPQ